MLNDPDVSHKLDLTVKIWHFAVGIIGIVVSGAMIAGGTMNRIENIDEYGTKAFQRQQEKTENILDTVRTELENLRESRVRIETVLDQIREQFKK